MWDRSCAAFVLLTSLYPSAAATRTCTDFTVRTRTQPQYATMGGAKSKAAKGGT